MAFYLVGERNNNQVAYCHQPIIAQFWTGNDCLGSPFWDCIGRKLWFEHPEFAPQLWPPTYFVNFLSVLQPSGLQSDCTFYYLWLIPTTYFKSIVTVKTLQRKTIYSCRDLSTFKATVPTTVSMSTLRPTHPLTENAAFKAACSWLWLRLLLWMYLCLLPSYALGWWTQMPQRRLEILCFETKSYILNFCLCLLCVLFSIEMFIEKER